MYVFRSPALPFFILPPTTVTYHPPVLFFSFYPHRLLFFASFGFCVKACYLPSNHIVTYNKMNGKEETAILMPERYTKIKNCLEKSGLTSTCTQIKHKRTHIYLCNVCLCGSALTFLQRYAKIQL